MAYLKLENITKRFGSVLAVDDFTIEIEKGEFLVLLGPSGCGKTTTLRVIAGLEIQSEGKIILDDRDISDVPPENRDMSLVFQNLALYPHMTVYDNIAFYLKNVRTPKAEIDKRVRAAVEKVEIPELLHRYPAQLSGGQRQRVALARSLVRHPKVFLLDEPLASLDAKLRSSMRSEFKLIHKDLQQDDGGTFVYVTHDQVEALTLGTRVAVMNEGRLVQLDDPDSLYHRPQNLFTATFIGSPEMNLIKGNLEQDGSAWVFDYHGKKITVVPDQEAAPQAGNVVLGVRPEDVEISTNSAAGGGMPARVLTVELLGQNYLVLLRIDEDLTISCLTKLKEPLADGASVELNFSPGKVHLFDPETQERQ
jgi:multiple sugar transport system ATP-binding protein